MAHPQVADGGDGLQIWRVAANVRNADNILIVRPEGKRPLGRRSRGCEDNIRMDLREI
jgi:hypothetical protein